MASLVSIPVEMDTTGAVAGGQRLARSMELAHAAGLQMQRGLNVAASSVKRDLELAHSAALQFEKGMKAAAAGAARDMSLAHSEAKRMQAGMDQAVGDRARAQWVEYGNAVKVAAMAVVGAALAIGAAIVAGIAKSVQAAMAYESAFAGVRKTVDGTKEQLDALSGSIRGLSKDLPISAVELAKVAESAGALGIKQQDIAGFTKVMAQMGMATNMSANQAAEGFARLDNIIAKGKGQFEQMGSVVVGLGNTMAATESEILAMSLRIAGAGNALDMTRPQILAWGAALASVGIEAEMGGSAISKTFLEIDKAVSEGGKELALFAKTAGMTGAEFRKAFREDASGATQAFIEGLGRLKAAGGDMNRVLADLGITEIRQRDTLLRLAGAQGIVAQAVDSANKLWSENNALQRETEARLQTADVQWLLLKNRLTDVAVEFGTALLPSLVAVMQAMVPMVEKLADLATAFSENEAAITKWPRGALTGIGDVVRGLVVLGDVTVSTLTKLLSVLGVVAAAGPGGRGVAAGVSGVVGNLVGSTPQIAAFIMWLNRLGAEARKTTADLDKLRRTNERAWWQSGTDVRGTLGGWAQGRDARRDLEAREAEGARVVREESSRLSKEQESARKKALEEARRFATMMDEAEAKWFKESQDARRKRFDAALKEEMDQATQFWFAQAKGRREAMETAMDEATDVWFAQAKSRRGGRQEARDRRDDTIRRAADATRGFTELLGTLAQLPAAFARATDSASAFWRALGGAEVGGKIGAQVGSLVGTLFPKLAKIAGPIGEAAGTIIGAVVGIFRKPSWVAVGKEAGRVWGIAISEEMAKEIEARAKALGISIASSSLLSLPDLLGSGAISGDDSIGQITGLFAGILAGAIPAKQGVEALGKSFSIMAEQAKKAGGLASDGMLAIIKMSEATQIRIEEVREYVKAQVIEGAAGLAAMFEYLGSTTDATAEDFERLGRFALAAVDAMRAQGFTILQIFEAIGPALDKAIEAAEKAGVEIGGAFAELLNFRKLVEENKLLIASVEGLAAVLKMLWNTGSLTGAALDDVLKILRDDFDALIAAGFTVAQANAIQADSLRVLDKLYREGKITLDEATKARIEDARAAGLLEPTAQEQMQKVLDLQLLVLVAIATMFKATLPAAVQAYIDALNKIPNPPTPTGGGGGGGTGDGSNDNDGTGNGDGTGGGGGGYQPIYGGGFASGGFGGGGNTVFAPSFSIVIQGAGNDREIEETFMKAVGKGGAVTNELEKIADRVVRGRHQ